MRRRLALLLPLLALAIPALRAADGPGRHISRAQLQGLLRAGSVAEARRALAVYRKRYAQEDDRWFAIEVSLRLGDHEGAFAAALRDPDFGDDPATPRRLAQRALRLLAFEDGDTNRPKETAIPDYLLALVEGGDPEATAWFDRHFETQELVRVVPWLYASLRDAGRGPLERGAAILDRRADEFRVAAAVGAARPGAKQLPEGAKERLMSVLADPTWRTTYLDVWHLAVRALGTCGGDEGRALLERLLAEHEERKLSPPPAAPVMGSHLDGAVLSMGLLAAGDWNQWGALRREIRAGPNGYDKQAARWALEALLHRAREGDANAMHGLGEFWVDYGPLDGFLRERVAHALLLEDEPTRTVVPLRALLGGLEAQGASRRAQMMARAWRLRSGEPTGLAQVLDGLATLGRGRGEVAEGPPGDEAAARWVGLRALLLYSQPGVAAEIMAR